MHGVEIFNIFVRSCSCDETAVRKIQTSLLASQTMQYYKIRLHAGTMEVGGRRDDCCPCHIIATQRNRNNVIF